jgi:hypothetical protein
MNPIDPNNEKKNIPPAKTHCDRLYDVLLAKAYQRTYDPAQRVALIDLLSAPVMPEPEPVGVRTRAD